MELGLGSTTTHLIPRHRADDLGDSTQPCHEEEGGHAGVYFGLGAPGLTITGQETMMVLQKHAMHGEDLCHYPAGRSGSHGVRQSCQPNLCRGDGVPRLLQLGEDNGPRRAALRFVKWLEMAPKESKT